MAIGFWIKTEIPYGVFSGFSAHPMELDGYLWPTLEHYYQAHKFTDPEHFHAVRLARSPMAAHKIGNDPARPLRPDWLAVKHYYMIHGAYAKFTSYPDLAALLLTTGDEEIIERSPLDTYWGEGPDGRGSNHLGRTLMLIRQELRLRTCPGRPVIRFYRTTEASYGSFSNFSHHPIDLDGRNWSTVEHYYQAGKFTEPEDLEAIAAAPTALAARQLGNDPKRSLRPDWEHHRNSVMWRGIQQKFTAHPALRALLLDTGDALLIEQSPYDSFWGTGPTGGGANRFGQLLAWLRAYLRDQDRGWPR